MPAFHQIRFFTGIVAAAAGLNAGATEYINWAKDIDENHNAKVVPYPHKWAPGEKLPEKFRVLAQN